MVKHPELQEEQRIIIQILAGQVQLFHKLIQPYERPVYRMALTLLHNEADAEDVAQEAFLKAFSKLTAFRGEAKFGTWLISITLNQARSRIRQKKIASKQIAQIPHRRKKDMYRRLFCGIGGEIPSEALERKEIRLLFNNKPLRRFRSSIGKCSQGRPKS